MYNQAKDFNSGVEPIKNLDEWYYVNKKGEISIDPKFRKVGDFIKL